MTSTPTFSPAALRLARMRRGLTQLEVAQQCAERGGQVTQSAISQWEGGRQAPSVRNLPVVAEVLACEVDDFFHEPEPTAESSEPVAS